MRISRIEETSSSIMKQELDFFDEVSKTLTSTLELNNILYHDNEKSQKADKGRDMVVSSY